MSNVLIIGTGEIGSAIETIEKEAGNSVSIQEYKDSTDLRDDKTYDMCHVCIPYSDKFIDIVADYLNDVKVEVCIIHSTVEMMTCSKLQNKTKTAITYSFCRGVHPNLVDGLKTFTKYVYGYDLPVTMMSAHLKKIGIPAKPMLMSWSNGELAKIMDTTYYGYNILFAKYVNEICEEHHLNFDAVYTQPNLTYNEGYSELGKTNVIRPVLTPPEGEIGGHCVVPNFKLLPDGDLKDWCLK